MNGLTKRQSELLDAIKRLTKKHGFAPSLEELALDSGFASRGNVHAHLVRLKERGLVSWHQGSARSIRVLDDSPYTPRALCRLTIGELMGVQAAVNLVLSEKAKAA